ncbi:MAG: DUF4010 domain-containing protein [Novosphingobium sp.]|nr:DUF4010 domain-containing protein [Novosphingobium sp.]
MEAATGYWTGVAAFWPAIALGTAIFAALRRRPVAQWLGESETRALAGFALIALVVWPLLPAGQFGPYGAWNPRRLLMVVVVVSGLSLAGHWAARLIGQRRGALVTAVAGAVISSTAVTAAMASRMREPVSRAVGFQAAIAAASAMMFLRVAIIVAAVAPFALPTFGMLALPGVIVSLGGMTLFLMHDGGAGEEELRERKAAPIPDDLLMLGPALALMALVMLTSVIARMALERYGDQGLITVLAISGALDVDSAVMTMGGLPSGAIDPVTAGLILLPPLVLNSLFKMILSIGIAGWARGGPPAAVMGLAALAAAAPAIWLI